jgi:hypothetical protein
LEAEKAAEAEKIAKADVKVETEDDEVKVDEKPTEPGVVTEDTKTEEVTEE